MPDTIQAILSDFFKHEAEWRRSKYDIGAERGHADPRELCSANWYSQLANLVDGLPDDDPGIRTLASFGWPVDCFRRGAGAESLATLRTVGYQGSPERPIVRHPDRAALERTWRAYVVAAERDRDAITRMLMIVEQLLDSKSSRSRARALSRFRQITARSHELVSGGAQWAQA